MDYPADATLDSLLATQAAATPDARALVCGDLALSYAELNARANQLAHWLIAQGTAPDDLIGVCMERSVEMVVALLGIVKAGLAYVPFDPDYPAQRLEHMLEDASIKVLLTQAALQSVLPKHSIPMLLLDQASAELDGQPATNPPARALPGNLAYVIFTSGSTGRPKGVMNEHRGIVNRLLWMQDEYGLTAADRVLQKTPFSFDVSVWEFFWPLISGATLVMAKPGGHKDPAYLAELINNERITTLHFVPSMLQVFLQEPAAAACASLQRVICSGEALSHDLQTRFYKLYETAGLHNLYGPTEAAIDVTYWACPRTSATGIVPIGRPVANTRIYIVDKTGQPTPVGVPGELWIGGIQVARGYVNRPELTAERFSADPFVKDAAARIYRTGDLVRYRADGVIEFLGRIDHQVKLRGFRIELGEIEASLDALPAIEQSLVLLREDVPGDKRLVAYVSGSHNIPPDVPALRKALAAELPEYMVPSAFVVLETFPLLPNGKVDRKALPAPDSTGVDAALYVAPRSPLQELLTVLWANVLGAERVGIRDNFFLLGGHSLLAAQLVGRIRSELQLDLPLQLLFQSPTIEQIAAYLETLQAVAEPIHHADRNAELPLSYAQQRVWLLNEIEADSAGAYNLPFVFRLTGAVNEEALQRAVDELVQRHESLRTSFPEGSTGPIQHIAAQLSVPLELERFAGRDDTALQERLQELATTPMDIKTGPLLRLHLLRLNNNNSVLLIVLHHIIADGWSVSLFLRELGFLYNGICADLPDKLPALPIQYADYAAWQRAWLDEERVAKLMYYWRAQLSDAPALLELPLRSSRPAQQDFAGEHAKRVIPVELANELRALARAEQCTLFMVMLAAFDVLLHRYSGQDDIVVGTPMSGRYHQETEGVIGFFLNMLAIRTNLGGNPDFTELLARTRRAVLDAYAHQDLPFEKLVEELHPVRDLSRSPIFQVLLTLQQVTDSGITLAGLQTESLAFDYDISKYDLSAFVVDAGNELTIDFEYSTSLFDAQTIEDMLGHYEKLLHEVVRHRDVPVRQLRLLSDAELSHLLTDWNATAVAYPADATLDSLLATQAAGTPDAEALVCGNTSLSYAELNARANQLAHWLIAQGTAPDDLIGVCMERSVEMVVALLGIVKAGLAYVPFDPDYPAQRLEHMLEDADIKVLLTQAALQSVLPPHSIPMLLLDQASAELDGQPATNPPARALPGNLAYVIFTSGSTGRPKGVMNEHRGIVNRLLWMQDEYGLTADDRVLQKTPFSFDVSVWEFFWPLISGATLVMAKPGGHKDPAYLAELINNERITTLHFVPSMLQVFLQEPAAAACATLQRVICSGEALSHDLQTRFYKLYETAGLHNLYGPTEAAIDVTYWACPRTSATGIVPIGRPVANTRIYIVDKTGQPTPVGVPGELWIGGIQVARGYVNRPELTAERFSADPFVKDAAARIYRTGDLVRYRADGVIEFLGRIDHQVKLRGFRIELGEIEASLDALPAIEQSLVLLREDVPGDKRLVAYVSGSHNIPPDVPALRKALAAELPEYMVPSAFVVLETFPLLPNGKVDRKALPEPEWTGGQEYLAPRSETEKQLASIWEIVLKVDQVGVHDDFFELGGHSLLATQIISRVRNIFGVAPELRALFNNPTLGAFALQIEARQRGDEQPAPPILPVPHFKGAPLSFAQQRLWFLDQLEDGNVAYNVPSAIRLKGKLDLDTLEAALNDVVARHESLRTIFGQDENGPVQIIAPELTLALLRVDMSGIQAGKIAAELTHLAREPFDLAHGPLLRLHALRIAADEHIVALVIHHIIADAWSLNILFGELMSCYDARQRGEAANLPALPVQFADFAIWQRNWLTGTELERQLEFWKTILVGAPAAITLPTDRPHPPAQSYNGAIISRTLGAELGTRLEALARQHHATLFMTLLAAFDVLLARYSGEDDIVVGTPIAGRNRSETEGLIGFFLNTLCLRADLSENPSFSDLLQQVSRNTLNAYAHQDLPFESLVEALKPPRDTSRTPLFQVLFTLQNSPATAKKFDDLQLEGVQLNQNTAKFELSLGVQETPDGLLAGFEYNTDLFDRDTIEVMFDHFERILTGIVANPGCAVRDLPMLAADEEQALLSDRNATAQSYPREQTLHELFATQVRERPDAEAVVCAGQSLSYAELNRQVHKLARCLRELGAGPDTPVALCTERSLDMVTGVLGILKAGAAYVPLDPAYPAERIAYMLEDSSAPILVTQAALLAEMPTDGIATVCIDQLPDNAAAAGDDLPDNGVDGSALAYIIYTSGSTGKPKGVQLEHKSVINFLTSMAKTPGFSNSDRLLAVTTLCFDISVLELLLPLTTGGTVVVATRDESVDGYALGKLIRAARITVMQATPATWRMLIQAEWAGNRELKVLCGGEALDRELAANLHQLSAGVWNMYGPTETTIWSSCHLYKPADAVISVGKPIGNTQFYILDNRQRPVPAGVSGELYIGGDGVARGYRERPELTAERFLDNPFRRGERMYRTGDLARFLKNGQVQVLGRTDFQVKLRGYRIELGEIEAAMQSHRAIGQSVVVLREDTPGDQRLVGYLKTDLSPDAFDTNELREHLYALLPQYMVPSAFVILDKIPLTPNGKVNRKALPAPDWGAEQEYVAPETPTEQQLAEIWQGVLQIEKIGTQDNFFVLGGHSLLATQLVARIRHAMNIELPLLYIFDYPSIAALATAVEAFRLATATSGQDMDDDDLEDISI